MKIALVGGTGDIGTGFAVRWGANHEVIIGSRKEDRAMESAEAVGKLLGENSRVWGADNSRAIAASDVVVLCVPYEHLISATSDLASSYSRQLVISPVVPMSYNGVFFQFDRPIEGSAALQIKSLLPEGMRIVSGFHTICASALQSPSRELKSDVLICGDDSEALDVVVGLVQEIKKLRPLLAGPLAVSATLECLTPMLLNVSRKNKIRQAGIAIVSER